MSFVLFEESKLPQQHSNSLWNIANFLKECSIILRDGSNSDLSSFLKAKENAFPLGRAAIFSSSYDFSLRIKVEIDSNFVAQMKEQLYIISLGRREKNRACIVAS